MQINTTLASHHGYNLGSLKAAPSLTQTPGGGRERAQGQPQHRHREEPKTASWPDIQQAVIQGSVASFAFSLALLGLGSDAGDKAPEPEKSAKADTPSLEDLLSRAAADG